MTAGYEERLSWVCSPRERGCGAVIHTLIRLEMGGIEWGSFLTGVLGGVCDLCVGCGVVSDLCVRCGLWGGE